MTLADSNAEFRLLAAGVQDPPFLLTLQETLFTEDRVELYKAMVRSYNRHANITYEGVMNLYGKALPPELEMARPSRSSGLIEYLADLALRRQMVRMVNEVNVMVARPGEIDKNALQQVVRVQPILATDSSATTEGISRFTADLHRKSNGTYRFVDTGLPFLNVMLGGEWPRQGMSVIIGASGGGKTALVCHSSLNMARLGIATLVISLEMPKERLVSRYVANMASVNGLALRSGKITDDERQRVNTALEEFASLPIYILDNPTLSATDIANQARRHRDEFGVEAFFVDYLQNIGWEDGSAATDEHMYLGRVTQQLRNVARQEDMSVILLAQQNRQFRGIQSISGSGKVGNIADTVIEIVLKPGDDDQRQCELDFHKNRDGPTGPSVCTYRPAYLRFE